MYTQHNAKKKYLAKELSLGFFFKANNFLLVQQQESLTRVVNSLFKNW